MEYIVEAFDMEYVLYHEVDKGIAEEEKSNCTSREEFERTLDSQMIEWFYNI